jgi:hypothetical protein
VMDITSQSGSMAVKASPSVGLRAGHWLRDSLDDERVRASAVLVLDEPGSAGLALAPPHNQYCRPPACL